MRLISRFTPPSTPSRAIDDRDFSTAIATTYAANDTEVDWSNFAQLATEGYQGNGIVFAVILARMSLFSEARFKYRALQDKRLFGDESLGILEEPWPGGTTGELLSRVEQDWSLAGNSYLRRVGDRLERLRPDLVDVIHVDQNVPEVLGYLYWRDGRHNDADFIAAEEVAHSAPIPDPVHHARGMSWLTPVVREVNSDRLMSDYRQNYFANSATPNALIKYQQRLSRDALIDIQHRWQARYGGTDGWKTAVLDQGADFQVIGSNMEQIDYVNVQAATENRIAAAGGVPAIIVGLKEGLDAATYSNFHSAMRRFADMTIRPNWRHICQSLEKIIDVPPGAELWYDTTDIAALREGEQERAETMQVMAAAASTLLMSGYEPDSVNAALTAGDLTLLQHTGLLSVQLQKPGQGEMP